MFVQKLINLISFLLLPYQFLYKLSPLLIVKIPQNNKKQDFFLKRKFIKFYLEPYNHCPESDIYNLYYHVHKNTHTQIYNK